MQFIAFMNIFIKGHTFHYEMENIARLFTKEVAVKQGRPEKGGDFAYLRAAECQGQKRLLCYVRLKGVSRCKRCFAPENDTREQEFSLGGLLFSALSEIYGFAPPWGTVTGVRPAKYAFEGKKRLGSWKAAEQEFINRNFMRQDKAQLAIETAINSEEIRNLSNRLSASLYISIPFCPTRCSYCSFVSKTTERDGGKQLEQYLGCLLKEIKTAAEEISKTGLELATIYIGGGTPTVLSAAQLERLLNEVNRNFDVKKLLEFTVESGRPDTITPEKLKLIKQAGATRICINPQTFNDEVLKNIGRRHCAAQIDEAFEMAKAQGIENINADLIAGLPGDTAESFEKSLLHLLGLAPKGITVHALTVKRASNLHEEGGYQRTPASQMVDFAYKTLTQSGYKPYYMYRQKNTVDNLENVGYSLPGFGGLYNVFIMEELHTIIACGAGAVTKLVQPGTGYIERVFNYKYPAEYISGFGEMLHRKGKINEFYQSKVFAEG